MTGLAWEIDGTPCGDVMDEPPTLQIGATLTYSFSFPRRENETRDERLDRHETVRQRVEYAGDDWYDTYQPITGAPRYRDQSPNHDRLVGIDIIDNESLPRYLRRRAARVWGVIVGGADTSDRTGAFRGVDLEVFVLAPYDDYLDKQLARDALETDNP